MASPAAEPAPEPQLRFGPSLPSSGHVVLGLLERYGPATPYQLDRLIASSIGYFWGFPRSQLYAEAARLTRRGLVDEARQPDGRRRRTLSITAAGRAELARWLRTTTDRPTEIRDEGLLRLFFVDLGSEVDGAATVAGAVRRLADEQVRAHRRRLAEYEAMAAAGRPQAGTPQRATLELGLRFERVAARFWGELAEDPSGVLESSDGPALLRPRRSRSDPPG